MSDITNEHEELKRAVESNRQAILNHIDKRFEEHESVMHRNLLDKKIIDAADRRIESKVDDLSTDVELLAEALLGPKRDEFMGGGRRSALGMESRLASLENKIEEVLKNQKNGVQAKMNPADRAVIWAAAVTAVGWVVANFLGLL